MNFALTEMSFLKYFVPIIIEGNKRNIKSRFYIIEHNKYTSPFIRENILYLKKLCDDYHVDIYTISALNQSRDITFFVEDSGIEYANDIQKKISLVYGTDFVSLYKNYIDKVDHVIFPSKFYAEHYNKITDKNLYLGCPKFDVVLNKQEILQKYNIPDTNNVLILFPRLRDANKVDLILIYKILDSFNLRKLVKTRGKDPVNKKTCPNEIKRNILLGDRYFEDQSWFPHTTLELMTISKLVINFDSAAIKECIYTSIPLLNFHIKENRVMEFLYDYNFCLDIDPAKDPLHEDMIDDLINNNFESEFEKAIKNHLLPRDNISKNILDTVL